MSVNLSPLSARDYTVGAADDPYKKYWWGILGGFALTGLWLCIPVMETSVGSVHVDTAAKPGADAAAGAEQNLDSADNPAGAPGGALDLSMDGAVHKSKGPDDLASMLYQAPPEDGAAAAGKPLGDATAASAASLAQQLKDAGKKTDASGWGEKAQRGFDAPHLAGAGLSGAGSLGSGGSSASAGGSVGAFGTRNADVGMAATHGLQDDGQPESAGFKALKASAGAATAPNLRGSDEAMHAGMSQAFDGMKGKPVARIGTGAMAQANAALSAAPINLKANDPKLDSKTISDPPMAPTPASTSQNMGQQLVMMAATVLIGGLIPGVGGQMAMMMGMMMMQQQQQQAAAAAAAKSSAATNQRLGT